MERSVITKQRRLHENIDKLQQIITEELSQKPASHKKYIVQQHRSKRFLDQISSSAKRLKTIYDDQEGVAQKEVENIGDLNEFYNRLKEIKEFYRKNPDETLKYEEIDSLERDIDDEIQDLDPMFSGEEMFGKYLDLNSFHLQYMNLKDSKQLTYLNFLGQCDDFEGFSMETRSSPEFGKYIEGFKSYLESFIKRTRPLCNFIEFKTKLVAEFNTNWQESRVKGWQSSDGLFCNACLKSFATSISFESHKTGKKHLKNSESAKLLKQRLVALSEFLVRNYLKFLDSVREETKSFVDAKQLMTERERRELVEGPEPQVFEGKVEEEQEENDEERIYNPLKLPLGWDGKPIPYWLWKLHGLGIEFPCEICGNFVYMGRKAFDAHFQEWRHTLGMKCLGIPNTKAFHDITRIEDAYALWEKIKREQTSDSFIPDTMEEYEDDEGNVFIKKTFEDLKRQGII